MFVGITTCAVAVFVAMDSDDYTFGLDSTLSPWFLISPRFMRKLKTVSKLGI